MKRAFSARRGWLPAKRAQACAPVYTSDRRTHSGAVRRDPAPPAGRTQGSRRPRARISPPLFFRHHGCLQPTASQSPISLSGCLSEPRARRVKGACADSANNKSTRSCVRTPTHWGAALSKLGLLRFHPPPRREGPHTAPPTKPCTRKGCRHAPQATAHLCAPSRTEP